MNIKRLLDIGMNKSLKGFTIRLFLYPAVFGRVSRDPSGPYSIKHITIESKKSLKVFGYFSNISKHLYIVFKHFITFLLHFQTFSNIFIWHICGYKGLTNRNVCGICGLTLRSRYAKMRHTPLLSTFLHK